MPGFSSTFAWSKLFTVLAMIGRASSAIVDREVGDDFEAIAKRQTLKRHNSTARAPNEVPNYGQCGGIGDNGSKECSSASYQCVYYNDYWSQCVPVTTTPIPTTPPITTDPCIPRTTLDCWGSCPSGSRPISTSSGTRCAFCTCVPSYTPTPTSTPTLTPPPTPTPTTTRPCPIVDCWGTCSSGSFQIPTTTGPGCAATCTCVPLPTYTPTATPTITPPPTPTTTPPSGPPPGCPVIDCWGTTGCSAGSTLHPTYIGTNCGFCTCAPKPTSTKG